MSSQQLPDTSGPGEVILAGKRLRGYGWLRLDEATWRAAAFWVVHGIAALLVAVAALRAAQHGALALFAAIPLVVSSPFMVVAPIFVLRHERRRRRFLRELIRHLEPDEQRDFAMAADRADRGSRPLILIPIALVIWALVGAPGFFAGSMALGEVPAPAALLNLFVLGLGAAAAGAGIAAAFETVLLARAAARFSEPWRPFIVDDGVRVPLIARFAERGWRDMLTAGVLLLPGVLAVTLSVGAGGLPALIGINLVIIGVTAAMLVVPSVALHRRRRQDQDRYLADLSQRIGTLAQEVALPVDEEDEERHRNGCARLGVLLELRSQAQELPASPAESRLLRWRLPVSGVVPILVTFAGLPFS